MIDWRLIDQYRAECDAATDARSITATRACMDAVKESIATLNHLPSRMVLAGVLADMEDRYACLVASIGDYTVLTSDD